jgi:hypothetical protein
MSTKRVILPFEVIDAGDMSGTLTSLSTNIQYLDRVGYHIVFTGSPTGTFSVEVSNDDTNYVEVTLTTAITASGSGDTAYIEVESAAPFVRLKYTFSSGTGSLTVTLTGKSISG